MSDRMFRLMERHQKLDRLIAEARKRRSAEPFEILRLKKLKLAIKDRIVLTGGVEEVRVFILDAKLDDEETLGEIRLKLALDAQ